MSRSHGDEPAPETSGTTPEPAKTSVDKGRAAGADVGALTRDLDEVQRGKPERAFNIGASLGILVTVAALIFVLQNRQSTGFDWLWFDFELPLWAALVGGVLVGIVLVMTILAVHARRQRRIGRRRDAAGRLRRALTGQRKPREPGRPPRAGTVAEKPTSPA